MKRAAIGFALCVTAAVSGCWRPYYGQTYAQPAYPQTPVYTQPAPVYSQPAPVFQPPPQVVGQPCCQPNPCCTPY
jgi:hypothetical protein